MANKIILSKKKTSTKCTMRKVNVFAYNSKTTQKMRKIQTVSCSGGLSTVIYQKENINNLL